MESNVAHHDQSDVSWGQINDKVVQNVFISVNQERIFTRRTDENDRSIQSFCVENCRSPKFGVSGEQAKLRLSVSVNEKRDKQTS